MLRRMWHLRSADLKFQGLTKLQFRVVVCIRTRRVGMQNTTRFFHQICSLVKL